MVVWQSAGGELTDIQRLDIWSHHQGLLQPLSHVVASVFKMGCPDFMFYFFCLIDYWERKVENYKRDKEVKVFREGDRKSWLMLTESDKGETASGFVFPADPNTKSFLTQPKIWRK